MFSKHRGKQGKTGPRRLAAARGVAYRCCVCAALVTLAIKCAAAALSQQAAAQSGSPQRAPSGQSVATHAVDEQRVRAAGIRRLVGEHLILYTDLPRSDAVDSLPKLFDQAYSQWCDYFQVSRDRGSEWLVRGRLMLDKAKFTAAGLLPGDLPPFQHGYSRGNDLWLFDRPSDYARRHLLLHEGTHAFMSAFVSGFGAAWYTEGVAELLATHDLTDGKLTLKSIPKRAEDVPFWGRIKWVTDAVAAGRLLSIDDVMHYEPRAYLENEPYGWSWALAAFLDGHPRYRERFRKLQRELRRPDFSRYAADLLKKDRVEVDDEWRAFVNELRYGYDLERSAIEFAAGAPLPAEGAKVTVRADRGWQSSGIQVKAAATYRLRASGRYQVANQPKVWECEPGGVSIRYWRGRPLGILLACVRSDRPSGDQQDSGFLRPIVVGLGTELIPTADGTLFFRVNDSPAELRDNSGTLEVEIAPGDKSPVKSR